MAVLVVGSAGYVGRRVLQSLRAAGVECVGADLRTDPGLVDLALDLCDPTSVSAALRDIAPSTVISLAYLRSVDTDANPHRALEVNLLGVNRLFVKCQEARVPRLVYASSTAVYGDPSLYAAEHEIREDEFPRWPRGLYGWMKQLNESLAERYNRDGLTQFVGLRLGSMQGARKGGIFDPFDRLVDGIIDKRSVTLPWSHEHRFGFVHVQDAADAFVGVSEARAVRYPIYNLGSFAISMGDFAAIAATAAGGLDVQFEEPGRDIRHVSRVSGERLADEFGLKRRTIEEWFRYEIDAVAQMTPRERDGRAQRSQLTELGEVSNQ